MMAQPGTPDNPLRVAIIGSGPSGFYAADHLQRQEQQGGLTVHLDMFDRLPTPYGLVRGGVAPDHPKIKSVTAVYERIARRPNFRFFGNVTFGRDLTLADAQSLYHAVVLAVGAQTDRTLGIPGEDLPGSHAATEFVAWYNGHPDYRDLEFDLTQEAAVVIGVGNVAMDVTRILSRTYDELYQTDIADYALEALRASRVRTVYVLGRRGPAQAAFTNPEIRELGELAEAGVIVRPDEVALDPLSRAYVDSGRDKTAIKNVEILSGYAQQPPRDKPRQIVLRFLVSPVEIVGSERVEAIKIVRNELYQADSGELRPRATDAHETIPVGLVFRSVGYRGVPLPGVPFDERAGIIPNDRGRVLAAKGGDVVPGLYATGWIKRGPSGIIGTNKPDSVETTEMLLEDVRAGRHWSPGAADPAAVEGLLRARGVRYDTFEDWLALDALEQQRGQAIKRPRLKFSRVDDILDAVDEARDDAPALHLSGG